MRKILIAGNPNVGKSTLFNSLTKSSEHTGNFHGVTVEEKFKIIKFKNEEIEFVDLPGLYSLNTFSQEEEISKDFLLRNDAEIWMLADINCLRKNLYLCQQLNELGISYKLLINSTKNFKKKKNKLDFEKLKNKIKNDVFLINAKKYKINQEILEKIKKPQKNELNYLEKYIKIIKNTYNIDDNQIILALNGNYSNLNNEQIKFIKSFNKDLIKDRYDYIDSLLVDCIFLDKNFVYGKSKLDKILLNPFVAIIGFLLTFFAGFYVIFFLIGPLISSLEEKILNTLIINPFMNFLYITTDNIWLIEFFRNGVFSSVVTIVSFVPQVCLLFIFLSILEESGIISRMAYVFDDILNLFGLNGKALYIMFLGLGCNSMSTTATRNLGDKNLKIKSAIINPYISCMARLPVYVLIASAFFENKSLFIIFGLYVLGLIVALIMSAVLSKTILKSKPSELLLEFPPLKGIDLTNIIKVGRKNATDFFKRVFTVVLSAGVIVWILTHTQFNLQYTDNMADSVMFFVANKISFILKPIGLNSAGIVCALVVGVLAKEMIVSTMAICNNVTSQKMLIASLSVSTSVINFTMPSAVSFLIFSLLYCPCVSNLAVIKKETDKFYMWFSLISQFTIAYLLSFVVYQALTNGIVFAITIPIVITLIMLSIILTSRHLTKKCSGNCPNCNKKS